jgi:hypothetical protein
MSTGAIIAIVVVVLIVLALLAFVVPRMRARARVRAREHELEQRRERVAGEHRAEADQREQKATQAEQRSRIAEREANAERAQAELHQERAGLHERGMADDELIEDHERDRFEGTSAMQPATDDAVNEDRGTLDDDRHAPGGSVPASEYDRGRHDEAAKRFNRDDETVAEREDTTTR